MNKISSALISVYSKEKLSPIIKKLHELGVKIYSTGGTQSFIEAQNVAVTAVEELTSYPSILGGRVKTLHPKVFGGILARRDEAGDVDQLKTYDIPEIDLVIVDLYPFEETVQSGAEDSEIIEQIDIGGISLIRAAAKNYKDTLVVSDKSQYDELQELLEEKQGFTTTEDRKAFAKKAFQLSSHYDTAIYDFFSNGEETTAFKKSIHEHQVLRYGENPHQEGIFYGDLEALFDKLHGKALSYNNLVDIDAAVNLIREFKAPTFAILKHTNPCGIASRENMLDAYRSALACDNISAFGGILIANRKLDTATCEEIHKLFCEVVIAPDFEESGLATLMQKKNRIILRQKEVELPKKQFKSLLNGVLLQDVDLKTESLSEMKVVTKASPSPDALTDLEFALKCAKHLKSNTIAICKDKQMIGAGCGQTSRVDALNQAILKASVFGFTTVGSVMASDAFFPFPDCVEIGHKAGVVAVLQPGGSIKDQDSIDICDQAGMAMVFTGVRHFKH